MLTESKQEKENLLCCDDPKPPLYHDVAPALADAACQSALKQGMTSFRSPCPVASWDTEAFKDRIAYVHTLDDRAVPHVAQSAMVQATGQKWITREIQSAHSPQLSAPEELAEILVELADQWNAM